MSVSAAQRTAIIASGTGRYADSWHPFAETSRCLTDVLGAAGLDCVVADVDEAVARAAEFDLLVVNAGDPWRSDEDSRGPDDASVAGLRRAMANGTGLLALHAAVASLRDYPEWAPAIGAVWLPGVSFHPPADVAAITGGRLPDGDPVGDFEVHDERYCRLQPIGRVQVVATHAGAAGPEPTAWVTTSGANRTAVDLLGHDERSYDAEGHRLLVAQLARWAARQ